jgi:FHA domain
MSQKTGQFTVSYADLVTPTLSVEQDGIRIGRVDECEVVLNHRTVSRVHAGINYQDSKYTLVNLSSSNVLTLNGRKLAAKQSDVLADGDTIQIGPFTLLVGRLGNEILLVVDEQFASRISPVTSKSPMVAPQASSPEIEGVLDVFWEKRKREKEDWGTRLRPTEKPKPGKAMFNWKPTRDLRPTWRFGLFTWAFLMIAVLGAYAYFRHPETYAPKPLSNPHASNIENSSIAVKANADSCTTCHTLNEPIENSCIKCHSATEFHASNTKAHEQAGITCTMCHHEHRGSDFDMKATAIQTCAECHNDNNKNSYNGKTVHTAHGGSYGYPVVDGVWKWKGVYREVADAIPEINRSATGDKDEQAKLSRQFHTVHLYRLKAVEGLKGNKNGLITCSTCHETVGANNVDRVKPRQTCAVCHTTPADASNRDKRFGATPANCISCHVQHPYSGKRWSEFLTEDALDRRKEAVSNKIKQLSGQ